ncbi:MAG: hypothetical protein Q4G27_08340 [Flavobacteriaceae bacterium]|nr:hypothetical protein [Flavobacteriaceae bacterium]
MKKLIYISTALFAIIIFAFTMNEYHTSTTKVEKNSGATSLTFTSKLITQDLEKAIGVSSENFDQFDAATERYLRKNFTIIINGNTANFNYAKAQISPKATRLYFEVPNVGVIKTIEIRNALLVNEFADQQNFMTFNIDGKRDSFVTKKGSERGKITL